MSTRNSKQELWTPLRKSEQTLKIMHYRSTANIEIHGFKILVNQKLV